MREFDFIEATIKAYSYVWEQRQQLLRISLAVLGIKILSFALVLLMDLQDNLLRQGLLLIPAHLVEGIVVCQILVMAIYDKSHEMLSKSRLLVAHPILAGTIIYVLIKLCMAFFAGMTFPQGMPVEPQSPPDEAQNVLVVFLFSLGILALLFWAFRLIWMYIPVALGFSLVAYMHAFKSFSASFVMIGTTLLSCVPVGLVMLFLLSIVHSAFPSVEGQTNFAGDFASAIVQGAGDYMMVVVSSLALAYGFFETITGKSVRTQDD